MSPAAVSAARQADVNLASARRRTQEGFSKGNLDVIEELISPDCAGRQRGNGPRRRRAKRVVSTPRGWLSGFRLEIQDRVTHDDVWTRSRATATSTGRFPGSGPAGKTIDITVLGVVRIGEGRVAGHRGVADQLEVALQRTGSARLASRALTRTAARAGQASPPHTGITWSRACPATSGQKCDITRK